MASRRRGFNATCFATALLLSASAHAREPSCPDVSNAELETTLTEVDDALNAHIVVRARRLLESVHPRIPCLTEVVHTDLLARYARQRAAVSALEIDTVQAQRWARLARTLDPSTSWRDRVPQTHPSREMLDTIEPAQRRVVADRGLDVGTGAAFLDGRYLTRPEGEAQMPHLLQVGDAYGRLTLGRWQDGLSFPTDLLGPPNTLPAQQPSWVGQPPGAIRGPRPVRARRMQTAAGLGLTTATLLGTAWITRAAYVQRPSDGLRTAVNGATVASVASGLASAGVLGVALTTRR